MICQPCQADTHDDCTIWTSAASLGMRDRCSCWEYRGVPVVPAKVALPVRSNWTDEEIRDHLHDTGEDEFDTWIARNAEKQERWRDGV